MKIRYPDIACVACSAAVLAVILGGSDVLAPVVTDSGRAGNQGASSVVVGVSATTPASIRDTTMGSAAQKAVPVNQVIVSKETRQGAELVLAGSEGP